MEFVLLRKNPFSSNFGPMGGGITTSQNQLTALNYWMPMGYQSRKTIAQWVHKKRTYKKMIYALLVWSAGQCTRCNRPMVDDIDFHSLTIFLFSSVMQGTLSHIHEVLYIIIQLIFNSIDRSVLQQITRNMPVSNQKATLSIMEKNRSQPNISRRKIILQINKK